MRQNNFNYQKPILLENTWSFWYDKYIGPGQSFQEYEAALHQLGSFSSIQDFWKWYNFMPPITQLPPRSSYHLMKHGIKPLWEDEANAEGGNLSIKVKKDISQEIWLYLVLSVVGEQLSMGLEEDDDICGLTVNMRKEEVVFSLWNKRAEVVNIDRFIKHLTSMIPNLIYASKPIYKVHKYEADFTPKQ